jgi:hypothetical protein
LIELPKCPSRTDRRNSEVLCVSPKLIKPKSGWIAEAICLRCPYSAAEVATVAAASAVKDSPSRLGDCIHLGKPLDRVDASGRACHCAGKWLRACGVHGRCTITEKRAGVDNCQLCPQYESDRHA